MESTCQRCGVAQAVSVPNSEFLCETCAVLEVEQAAKQQTRNAIKLIALGAGLLGFTALMAGANWNPGYDPEGDPGMGLVFYVATGGVGALGVGFTMLKFRPRLRR